MPISTAPEEWVEWRNEFEIEFKVILKELSNQRERFLVLSLRERALFILRQKDGREKVE